jgi:glycosyltransferase involved in cell wall biosynthesis
LTALTLRLYKRKEKDFVMLLYREEGAMTWMRNIQLRLSAWPGFTLLLPHARTADTARRSAPRRVLFILENLPVPLDRRAWQEARALHDAGYVVTVVCPRNQKCAAPAEVIDGIRVYRHWLPLDTSGVGPYLVEYAAALFWEFALSFRVLLHGGFDVIHAGNPPDTIFLVGGFFKLFGKKFVFDFRDLCPELFEFKFRRRGPLHALLVACERLTFRVADRVIANNPTFADLAVGRGGARRQDVTVVRHGPDLRVLKPVEIVHDYRKGRPHLVLYVGIMGPQDGVDLLIRAVHHAVVELGRGDIQFLLVGAGPEKAAMERLSATLGVEEYVTFTGYLTGTDFLETLSAADIGVSPDPKNALNDCMSMNKILEYMSFGLPVVMFDLVEGRNLAGECGVYAENNDPADFAARLVALLDDPDRRQALAREARERAKLFSWDKEAHALLAAYDELWAPQSSEVPDNSYRRERIP